MYICVYICIYIYSSVLDKSLVLHLPKTIVIITVRSNSSIWGLPLNKVTMIHNGILGICNIFEGTILKQDSRNDRSASLKTSCVSKSYLRHLRYASQLKACELLDVHEINLVG